MIVLSLIFDNHVCAYDTDTYSIDTVMKILILWMYDYWCNISIVCNDVTSLYLYSTNLILEWAIL